MSMGEQNQDDNFDDYDEEDFVEDTHYIVIEPGMKHILSSKCWCGPSLQETMASGAQIFKHQRRH